MFKKSKTVTDMTLLALLEEGILQVVNTYTPNPVLLKKGKPLKASKVGKSKGARYRWEIKWEGRRRTIMRSRLVFLATRRALIPTGYEVGHYNGDQFDDSQDNLYLVRASTSNLRNIPKNGGF